MIARASRLLAAMVLTGAILLPAAEAQDADGASPAADPSSLSRAFPLGSRPLCCRDRDRPSTTPAATGTPSRAAVRPDDPDRPATIIALLVAGIPIGVGVIAAAAVSRARAGRQRRPVSAAPSTPAAANVETLVADRCGQLVEVAQQPLRRQSGDRLLWVIMAVDLHTATMWTGLAQATHGDRPSLLYLSEVLEEMTLDLYMGGHRLEAILVDEPAAVARPLRRRLGVLGLRVLPVELLDPSQARTDGLLRALGSALAGQRISATAPGAVEEQLQRWTQEHNAALAAPATSGR